MNEPRSVEWLEDMLDRQGAEFDTWPDRQAASDARALILSNPQARSAFEVARKLDAMLIGRAEAFVSSSERHLSTERTIAAVLSQLPQQTSADTQPMRSRRWVAGLAASFIFAAFLGGALDRFSAAPTASDEFELAALDSLVYGPTEVELQ